jgi:hypothetical protein
MRAADVGMKDRHADRLGCKPASSGHFDESTVGGSSSSKRLWRWPLTMRPITSGERNASGAPHLDLRSAIIIVAHMLVWPSRLPGADDVNLLARCRKGIALATARAALAELFQATTTYRKAADGRAGGAMRTGRPASRIVCSIVSVYGASITRPDRPSTTKSKNRARRATTAETKPSSSRQAACTVRNTSKPSTPGSALISIEIAHKTAAAGEAVYGVLRPSSSVDARFTEQAGQAADKRCRG